MKILYEDNHTIAVVKPHGVLVQGDESGDWSIMDEVKAYIKKTYNKPGDVFLGLVHRLDRPVGGVVVFGKTSKGASRLSEQFREKKVKKVYWAVVKGTPKEEGGEVEHWLLKDRERNRVMATEHEVEGSKRAVTHYRVLDSVDGHSLIEVIPETGRPHQIRVALRSANYPIIGDVKYGSSIKLGGDIALFARSLTFCKPVGGEEVTVTADPAMEVFEKFRN